MMMLYFFFKLELKIISYFLVNSEMASPRCQSRDSSSGRCPSDESLYSGRGISGQSGLSSELALSLPTSLPPAAAALLPPQAMAAYLNAAAVAAAQQNRLMLNSNLHRERSSSPNDNDEPVLDFSKKRKSSFDHSDSNEDDMSDNEGMAKEGTPLDLSVSRKRGGSDSPRHKHNKISRPGQDFKPSIISPWSSSQLPFFAAAAGFSPKALAAEWNGRNKMHSLPSDATKALEKMSELSRIGEDIFRASNTNSSHVGGGSGNSGSNSGSVGVGATTGRHSAWQSHWLNKGADTAKDVLKCVWCKQSFPTLEAMTTHMKETKHCGVNVPPHTSSQQAPSSRDLRENASNSHNSSKSDLNLLIKETMPLPRKLVRGQDVWLGKGAEQTRQILKCMWCGQSFRSLSEMTQHMQETQHYTNIISQEQIISWKSGSGSHSGQGNSGSGRGESNSNNSNNGREGSELNINEKTSSTPSPSLSSSSAMNNSHVSAVLTCKVCDQAFSSLKELSNHMVKNAHYKEHIMRSITESGTRRRQTKEKRKKSLPVRKLLELERAQNDFKNGDNILLNKSSLKDISAGRITCEKCGDKIEMVNFVDHIRQCIGSSLSPTQKLKSALLTNSIIPPDSVSPSVTPSARDGLKNITEGDSTPTSIHQRSPSNSLDMSNKSGKESLSKDKSSSSPSVLNAIEQLIEKSFDTKPRHSSTNHSTVNQNSSSLGSSILKRLGIDENIDYTKPLVDAQTMNLLRTYHSQQVYLASSQFGHRERSGSESSSISERGSSRVDSLTPEKKLTHEENQDASNDNDEKVLKFKSEYSEEYDDKQMNESSTDNIKIKHEINDDENDETSARNISRESANRTNETDDDDDKPLRLIRPVKSESREDRESPISPSERRSSPASDRQSVKSNESSKRSMSSLGALSSMFDSLGSSEKAMAENGSIRKGNRTKAHPLAALQKLCDKRGNENSPNTRSGSSSSLQSQTLSASLSSIQNNSRASMLSFSWACNDGIITDDSNIKCAFCDTTFSSKGSYRHHLSKVHFMCDDALAESIVSKSSSGGGAKNLSLPLRPPSHSSPTPPSKSPISVSPKSNISADMNRVDNSNELSSSKKSPSPVRIQSSNERHNKSEASATPTSSSSSSTAMFDESPHSKFLKYTELAKQLSSKYV
jgi:teashirt